MCKYIGGCKRICQACRFWIGQGIHSLPFMFPDLGFLLFLEYFDISYRCLSNVKFLIISIFLTSFYDLFFRQPKWMTLNQWRVQHSGWPRRFAFNLYFWPEQKYFIMETSAKSINGACTWLQTSNSFP